MRDERGFALVITLLITALLVALSVEFVDEVFVDTSARQNFVDGQQASLLANSGCEAAQKLLLQYAQLRPDYSSLTDLGQIAKLLNVVDEQGTLQVSIEDESGKLNLNSIVFPNGEFNPTYHDIAVRLFRKLGLQPEILDAAADWVGTNEAPRSGGAKTPYYQTLKPPYVAKGGNLETFEELRLVKGFDAKTVEMLRPYVTVYSDNLINLNTAPKELLASLSEAMTDEMAQRIIDYRKVTPLKSGSDLANVSGMASSVYAPLMGTVIKNPEKGDVYRLISRATVKETTRIVEAVVRLGGMQPILLYWREY